MNIGGRIRTARRAAGLSQEEVARRAGLSLKGMGEIERGDIEDPHISSLTRIARALGVSVGTLLKEEEPAFAGTAEAPDTGRLEGERSEAAPPKDPQQWERIFASVRRRQREVEAEVEELVALSARGEADPYQVKWALDEAQDCWVTLVLALPGSYRRHSGGRDKIGIDNLLVLDPAQWEEVGRAEGFYNGIVERFVNAGLARLEEGTGQKAEPVPVGIGG